MTNVTFHNTNSVPIEVKYEHWYYVRFQELGIVYLASPTYDFSSWVTINPRGLPRIEPMGSEWEVVREVDIEIEAR